MPGAVTKTPAQWVLAEATKSRAELPLDTYSLPVKYKISSIYIEAFRVTNTYDHRALNTELPVRSAVLKQRTGGLVVRWVTTSEYPLLYVFVRFIFLHMETRFCIAPVAPIRRLPCSLFIDILLTGPFLSTSNLLATFQQSIRPSLRALGNPCVAVFTEDL